ncbi:proline-rich receptor-like protein kinase PERK15 [Lolium perenne]|uniref:proline-rich receptor-like protein kinase PERK15 n=1 Tax=Lolium perenne TaxID=4522 RepID=UPI0021F6631F|nr:proline-rich receptor-like protein kinase PERK12 [Lolium perenne]
MPRVLMESIEHLASAPVEGPPAPPPQSSAPPPPPASSPPPPPTPSPPKSPPPSSSPPPQSVTKAPPQSRPPEKSPAASSPPPVSPPPSSPPPTSRSPPPSSPPPSSPPQHSPPPSPASSTTPPSPEASRSPSQQSPPQATTSTPASPPPSQPANPAPATPTPSPPSIPAAASKPPLLETPGAPTSVPAAAGQATPAAPGTPPSTSQLLPSGVTVPPGPTVAAAGSPPPGTWQSPPGPAVAAASPPPTAPRAQARDSGANVPIGVIVGVAVAGFLLALASLFMVVWVSNRGKSRRPPMRKRTVVVPANATSPDVYPPSNGPTDGSSYEYSGSKSCFTYDELAGITCGFSAENVIGEGGFGKVYMGALGDGRRVAVKQLKVGGGQGEKEFRAEVDIISRIHHRHLVTLVGYCVTENHRLLVYEFVSNHTLEHHLHGKGLPAMDWSKRMKIAIGSARGLTYLHEDCHPRIIHRDIKSANILLDDAFEAKVADFGLAKLTNDAMTHVSTRVMGTFGYMAPEYASSGKLTDRSDVFSFGVVLLELITGRKPVDSSQPLGEESLVEWARPLLVDALETDDFRELADPALQSRYSKTEMRRMVEAAASCIRHSVTKRPRMVQVWRSLDVDGSSMDLTNGVKLGQSTAYDSGQYSADIEHFRRMAFEADLETAEYGISDEEDHRAAGSGRQERKTAGK